MRPRSGCALVRQAQRRAAAACPAPPRGRRSAPRRSSAQSSAGITASGRTEHCRAILRRASSGIGPVGAAEQDVGLDADRAQCRHRMLGRLGLQLLRRGDPRHQRHVDEAALLRLVLERELADRLEERQALDVADRAADLAQDDVGALGVVLDEFLDRVGDVRDHLHGAAEIVAVPLAGQHRPVDAPGRDACPRRGPARR